jgi:hypothetical protein
MRSVSLPDELSLNGRVSCCRAARALRSTWPRCSGPGVGTWVHSTQHGSQLAGVRGITAGRLKNRTSRLAFRSVFNVRALHCGWVRPPPQSSNQRSLGPPRSGGVFLARRRRQGARGTVLSQRARSHIANATRKRPAASHTRGRSQKLRRRYSWGVGNGTRDPISDLQDDSAAIDRGKLHSRHLHRFWPG